MGETVGPTSFEEATSDALLNPTDPDAPAGDEGQPESHPSYPSPWPYGEEVSPTEEEVGSFLQPSGAATGQGGLTEDPYLTESPSTVPPDAQDQEDFFEGV